MRPKLLFSPICIVLSLVSGLRPRPNLREQGQEEAKGSSI
jgi:hypothetical protein